MAPLHQRGRGVPGRARLIPLLGSVHPSGSLISTSIRLRVRARSASASARPADGDIGSTALSAAAASSSTSGRHRANRLTSTARCDAPKRPASKRRSERRRERVGVGAEEVGELRRYGERRHRQHGIGVDPGGGSRCQLGHVLGHPPRHRSRRDRGAGEPGGVGAVPGEERDQYVGWQPQSALDDREHPLVLEHRPLGHDVLPGRRGRRRTRRSTHRVRAGRAGRTAGRRRRPPAAPRRRPTPRRASAVRVPRGACRR